MHAALQRPDAYTAADKLTKPVWLVILGAAVALASILYPVLGVLGMAMSACASGVYLVDVRPKLLEIQGKSR
ncbi:transmembrane protein [Mycobacterium tuberculosis]|nr:transmembrane protein [Mycobacterium tuberculosis]